MFILLGKTDESCTQALAVLVQDVMNGLVPTSVRDHLLCCKLIGIPKDDGGVRPIAMALHNASSRTNDAIVDVLGHMQLGVGVPGGSERALHRVQCLLEAGSPNTVAVLVDFENAFREVALLELLSHDSLRPLWSSAHFAYSSPTPLFVFDQENLVDTIPSATGSRQGCKLGSLLFCHGLRKFQLAALELVAICDDVTIVGPIDSCMRVLDWMRNNSCALIGLTVKESKTKILYPRTTPPPVAIVEAATSRGMVLARGACKLLGSIVELDDDAKRAWVLKPSTSPSYNACFRGSY
jgi:hypothetical protein